MSHLVRVGNRELKIGNLDKVLYPRTGTTKAEVIKYYLDVADVMVPHLRGRPITFKRYPDGVEGLSFFEKRCPDHAPEWMNVSARVTSDKEMMIQCSIDDSPSLIWAANMAALELHVSLYRENPEVPTLILIDLDPGEGVGILECARLALRTRDLLESMGLKAFIKGSGGKGLHLLIPLNSPVTFQKVRDFVRTRIAEPLAREHGGITTSYAAGAKKGKILMDWRQNSTAMTMIAPYSLRARDRPYVSAPLRWEEVQKAIDNEDESPLRYEISAMKARIEEIGDPIKDIQTIFHDL